MTTVSFEDLAPACDPDNARLFCQHMYQGRDGYVIVTRISASGQHIVRSWAFQTPELLSMMNESLNALVADEGGRWNVYVSCAMHSKDPTEGGKKRGGKQTIDSVHDVRLDLDLKDESFQSPEAIDAFIAEFPVPPTLIVDSGIGAKHCYWILDEPVPRDEGERLNRAWWAMAQEMAGDVFIDRVYTADRIMRLPGTVRWPKEPGEKPARVSLMGGTGARVSRDRLWEPAEPAFFRSEAVRSEIRNRSDRATVTAKELLTDVEDITGWGELIVLPRVEEFFNDSTTWDQILIPQGWKVWKQDYESRRHWVRPGKTQGTSATTDYPPSPNVMTLFSNSADPRLVKLSEAEIPLTKFRVYAELKYEGDVGALARDIVNGLKSRASGNG